MDRNPTPYYILDMIIFVVLNAVGIWFVLQRTGQQIDLSELFTPLKLVIFGLGVYRLADIISEENITAGIRNFFKSRKGAIGAAIGDLINCPSCVGVWVAALLFYVYILFPAAATAILIIGALSALERLFAKVYNLFDAWCDKVKRP